MSQGHFNQLATGTASLEDVRRLAYELHKGQTDPAGDDYILHPERVANNVIRFFPDAHEYVIMAAWLHDTMEDCYVDGKKVDAKYLRSQGIPEEVIIMVELLTKPDEDERSYDEVIDDLIASGNIGAMMVKIADNGDNLHPTRLNQLAHSQAERDNPGKAERLKNRYIDSVKKLSKALSLDEQTVSKIFKLINQAPPLKQEFVL